ncbi:hypothetical protein [Curtobacterium sp. MCSS17_016]|uniref:hypothetical protein n=1 Tax=Curtobacterium sp. MCSS17_016 TaxID=2175644 RepID=UPI000DAA98C3|nr:hypothetical protein [Curtobacterium sp. MCSS17_016]WIE81545.1 hypothetical protein DEJ19_020110 [Curtobacterium sp. MCSS17_016]
MKHLRKIGAVFGRPTLSGWAAIAAAIAIIIGGIALLVYLNGSDEDDAQKADVITAPHAVATATAEPTTSSSPVPGGGATVLPKPSDRQQEAAAPLGTSENHAGPTAAEQKPWTSPDQPQVPSKSTQTFGEDALFDSSVSQSQVANEGTVPKGGGTASSKTTMNSDSIGRQLSSDVSATRDTGSLIPVKQDACLEDWVKGHIHDYDRAGGFTVTNICGHPAVALGGAAGIEYNTLRGRVNAASAPAGAKDIVYGNHPYLNASAAYTGSGKDNNGTTLIVVTVP